LRGLSSVLDWVAAYRLWQAPFVEKKLDAIRRHGGFSSARRVLDVGCGPGINTRHFLDADYLGLDLNPAYVDFARRRYGKTFLVADVRHYVAPEGATFDFILVNSFFHHVDDESARRILANLSTLLTDDGSVHILDLVLPREPGPARTLARWDRGRYARPLESWDRLFAESFEPVLFDPFPLTLFGVTLWEMVYFQGRRRR
jgi:SAM-dependent methyltransferase